MIVTAAMFHLVSIGTASGFSEEQILGYFIPMAAISVAVTVFCGWSSAHTKLKYLLVLMNGAALVG